MSLLNLSLLASSPTKTKVTTLLKNAKETGILPDLSSYSVLEAIIFLKDFRLKIDNKDPLLSVIDSILVPLMELDYHNPASAGPYDVNQNLNRTFDRDCLLSDLNEELLFSEVSDLLGIKYLSTFAGECNITVASGVTYGPFSRPMVSLPVRIGSGMIISVHFLVDTGAPRTEIPLAVFNASLAQADHIPSTFFGLVANRKIALSICAPSGNHVEVPILGEDFLTMTKATLSVDYADKTIKVIFKDSY